MARANRVLGPRVTMLYFVLQPVMTWIADYVFLRDAVYATQALSAAGVRPITFAYIRSRPITFAYIRSRPITFAYTYFARLDLRGAYTEEIAHVVYIRDQTLVVSTHSRVVFARR